jgi:uncharacterized Zn finger protein (UPF0148 family)
MAEEVCPNCGTPYEPGGTFCINCGAKRGEAKEAGEGRAPSKQPAEPAGKAAPEPTAEGHPAAKPSGKKDGRSDDEVLERLDRELVGEKAAAPGNKPPVREVKKSEPLLEPAAPALGAEPGEAPPTEPRKKSGKGCCVAMVVVGVLFLLVAIVGVALYFTGVFDEPEFGDGGAAFTHDFENVTSEDFTVWQTGPQTLVKPEKGMLKVRNALVGINYDPGANYAATCAVFIQSLENDNGWAGLALRVNPKGGDRYSFEIVPGKKAARIRKIVGTREPLVLVSAGVPALAVGAPFTVKAGVSGNDLTMEVNGTVVGRAADIGLIKGPLGLEVRGATAYFDDLAVEVE